MISHVIHGCSNVHQPVNAFLKDSFVMETMTVAIDPMKQMLYAVRSFYSFFIINIKFIETGRIVTVNPHGISCNRGMFTAGDFLSTLLLTTIILSLFCF